MISLSHGYLQKAGNRWVVTDAGMRVAQWTDEVINSQKALLLTKPRFRIAAFSWLAEEVLVPQFRLLESKLSFQFEWSYKIILSDLEQELIQSRSDYVIAGYPPNDPTIAYKKVSSHPWVVAVPMAWKKQVMTLKNEELIRYLQSKPYVRMTNLNPERIINFKPLVFSNLSVDGVVGVRSAIIHGLGWSHVPAMALKSALKRKEVLALDLPTGIKDEVSLWWLRSRKDTSDNSKILVKWISGF